MSINFSEKGQRKIHFHPFFLIDLIQACRSGQHEEAAIKVAQELIWALNEEDKYDSSLKKVTVNGGSGGVVFVPSLVRCRELGYEPEDKSSRLSKITRHFSNAFKGINHGS